MTLSLRFSALSDVGRVRKENQDSGYAGPHLLIVADGVGGAARGDIASATTVHQMRLLSDRAPDIDGGPEETLAGAITMAHSRIGDLVSDNPEIEGTSTTVVAGMFTGTDLAIAHVGDSRAYLLRDGELRALTRDHSFVQSLVDEGRITEEEARVHPNRNLILRAVDGVHEPHPDTSLLTLQVGDRLLFCSDGCCGSLTDDEMAELLATDNVDHAASTLVTAALDAGSTDNVTVVVAEVVEEEVEEQLPITVGAAAHPLRPTSKPGRLRRLRAEQPIDPEVARYAPRPPRRGRILRFLALVLVLLALAAAALFGAYKWTQTQYYIGFDNEGYVAVYRGLPESVFGYDLHTEIYTSKFKAAALGAADREAVEATVSATSKKQGVANINAMGLRGCALSQPSRTPQPSPTTLPTYNPSATSTPSVTTTVVPSATVTPSTRPGCPSSP